MIQMHLQQLHMCIIIFCDIVKYLNSTWNDVKPQSKFLIL